MSAMLALAPAAPRPNSPAETLIDQLHQLRTAAESLSRLDEDQPLAAFRDVETLVAETRPTQPVFCIRPAELRIAAKRFQSFPGRTLYAVKCNPHPFVLRTLYNAGVRDFDVASAEEIRLIDQLFGRSAGQFFNNPAKARPAISEASLRYGIRFYTVDCEDELQKVLDEAQRDDDLVIAVRLKTPSRDARYALSTKFGADASEAVDLLKQIQASGVKSGISFHVGSQCLSPEAFKAAIALTRKVLRAAGTQISVLNVGGGFPAPYPGDTVAPLEHYLSEIILGRRELDLKTGCMLMCEPGRGLVATAGSVVAQVVMRRDRTLYLNDGIFGSLQELGHPKERRPTRIVGRAAAARTAAFKIFGPTCDSNDVLGAPFVLPEDVREGDWIEVGMMGAYSLSMRTRFNGFHLDEVVTLET